MYASFYDVGYIKEETVHRMRTRMETELENEQQDLEKNHSEKMENLQKEMQKKHDQVSFNNYM